MYNILHKIHKVNSEHMHVKGAGCPGGVRKEGGRRVFFCAQNCALFLS